MIPRAEYLYAARVLERACMKRSLRLAGLRPGSDEWCAVQAQCSILERVALELRHRARQPQHLQHRSPGANP